MKESIMCSIIFDVDFKGCADPITHALTVLGSLPASQTCEVATKHETLPAIVRIEKTALSIDILTEGVLGDVRIIESTDIVRPHIFRQALACGIHSDVVHLAIWLVV